MPEDDYKELGSLDSCANYLHPLMEDKELKLQNA